MKKLLISLLTATLLTAMPAQTVWSHESNTFASTTTDSATFTTYSVSGFVRSHNPKKPVLLQLMQNNTEKYREIIAADAAGGQRDQHFSFEGVEPGIYTLVATKEAHLKSTIHNIVVSHEDLDLTKANRAEARLISMKGGDLNDDGQINSADLLILLGRYLESGEHILADINGDGQVDSADMNILLSSYLQLKKQSE